MEFAPRHFAGQQLASYKFPAFSVLHSTHQPLLSAPESCAVSLTGRCSSAPVTAALTGEDPSSSLMERAPLRQLPPGFRFHPTDAELVVQYLRRKVLARPLPAAVIPVVHSASLPDPWDLPGASEGEASYFFRLRQAPARGGGARRRRAASGYWKATGKEKAVCVQLQCPSGRGRGKQLLVGVKTALAFHRGKKGKARTDWVMHEYRLAASICAADKKMSAVGIQSYGGQAQSEWVVCRVSLKSRARRSATGDTGGDDDDTTAAGSTVLHRAASDHDQPSPSSSCVTDTCHASESEHQEEVSSAY